MDSCTAGLPPHLQRWAHCFDGPVPEDIPARIFFSPFSRPLRDYALQHMGFSVVTRRAARALRAVTGSGRILEVMCGTGAWTAALRQEGALVHATDNLSWMDPEHAAFAEWKKNARIPDIEPMDAVTAVETYGRQSDFLLMVWPPLDDPSAVTVLRVMRAVNPACRLLYLGENRGGATASGAFFREWEDCSGSCPAVAQARRVYRCWKNCGCTDTIYLVR